MIRHASSTFGLSQLVLFPLIFLASFFSLTIRRFCALPVETISLPGSFGSRWVSVMARAASLERWSLEVNGLRNELSEGLVNGLGMKEAGALSLIFLGRIQASVASFFPFGPYDLHGLFHGLEKRWVLCGPGFCRGCPLRFCLRRWQMHQLLCSNVKARLQGQREVLE